MSLCWTNPPGEWDVGAKYEIYRIMQDLVKRERRSLWSPEMPELLEMSDRIMIMCAGKQTGILGKTEATQVEVMKYATQFEDKNERRSVSMKIKELTAKDIKNIMMDKALIIVLVFMIIGIYHNRTFFSANKRH